jgi:rod shape-determining protein MreC
VRNYGRSDRAAFIAVGLIVISFLMMTFDLRASSQGVGGTLRNGVQTVVAPIQSAMLAVIEPVVDFADGLANLAGLRLENERLRERIEDLERDVVHVGNLESDVEELRELLDLRLLGDYQEIAVFAEVTGRGGTFEQSFTINKGTADGIQQGQPVVDARGALVGVIAEVSEHSASVLPITSRQAPGVTVRLPNGVRGTVEGQGTGRLTLTILDARERVLEGQLLQTYGPFGSSDAYPKSLDVGTVLSSATPEAEVIRVPVDPLADLERIEYVAVIPWPPDPGSPATEESVDPETQPLDADGNPIPEQDAENTEDGEGSP